MPFPSTFQVARNPTVNNSLITTPAWFVGDFQQLGVSCSTQSTHALVIQMSDEDGFQTVIPENAWFTVLSLTSNGAAVLPVGHRWSRTSSPSLSSSTVIFSGWRSS